MMDLHAHLQDMAVSSKLLPKDSNLPCTKIGVNHGIVGRHQSVGKGPLFKGMILIASQLRTNIGRGRAQRLERKTNTPEN